MMQDQQSAYRYDNFDDIIQFDKNDQSESLLQRQKSIGLIIAKEQKIFDKKIKDKKTKLSDWKKRVKQIVLQFFDSKFMDSLSTEVTNCKNESDEEDQNQKDELYSKSLKMDFVKQQLSFLKEDIQSQNITNLQNKLLMVRLTQKRLFRQFYPQQDKRDLVLKKFDNPFENLMHQCKKYENPGKNAKKIENSLQKFMQKILENSQFQEDSLEEQILKKHKVMDEFYLNRPAKVIGYKPSDFFKIKKYRIDVKKIPLMSSEFDDQKQNQFGLNQSNFGGNKNAKYRDQRKPQQMTVVTQNEQPLQDVSLFLNPIKLVAKTKQLKNPAYSKYEDIPKTSTEREAAKEKIKNMTLEDIEKYKQMLWKKQWESVVRSALRTYRFNQKDQMDKEINSKKFAISCQKEVRRKFYKSQRIQKEFVFRAKRIHREMLGYWRKKERELNEIRKKKERLEIEIRRREDEEREIDLQKKRLEFLMTQSSFYSLYMAQKLGLTQTEKPEIENLLPDNQVEIDQDAALENVQRMIQQNQNELVQYDNQPPSDEMIQENKISAPSLDELKQITNMDFSQIDQQQLNTLIKEPKMFNGELKEYQLKGLRWLDNLFDQGINGILADEMGLGKTIQAIALLAHLFESKNNYGPFLIVAPSSTLYNWQQEIKRFSPSLHVLPYWGSLKQRKTLRKYFSNRTLGKKESPFHIVITSYQLVVADEKAFHRLKWQYMILDEAQAIKNVNSQRWKALLSFNSRNRLLLTGTPIQNTMAELWALLHFIMPKLFDSHDQFQEWFSKDIEAHSQQQGTLNQQQLQRLHAILKPFMLRRIKKDVEHEIGQKKEFQIYCEMSKRQQILYNRIKSKLSVQDFVHMLDNKAKVENLMNLVMQFRKVCNHPELFERRPTMSPFVLNPHNAVGANYLHPKNPKEIVFNNTNPICQNVPKLVYDEIILDKTKSQIIHKYFEIYSSSNIQNSLFGKRKSLKNIYNIFSFLRFIGTKHVQPFIGMNINQLELLYRADQFYALIIQMHAIKQIHKLNYCYDSLTQFSRYMLLINQELYEPPSQNLSSKTKSVLQIRNLLTYDQNIMLAYFPKTSSHPIQLVCSSMNFKMHQTCESQAKFGQQIIFNTQLSLNINSMSALDNLPSICRSYFDSNITLNELYPKILHENPSKIKIPDFIGLIADSSKLKYLDQLLIKLFREGHRVLIFCQMTKMLDILEEYMIRKQYNYFRLDGSSNIADRRDMVVDFQTKEHIFVFLLSTRAGGLGVTLTAADTVIFYDNDWNPTMDAQATDRAHRIGQKKEVSVYRLITKGTIEERIVKRAQQKQNVQSTVYAGGAFKADIFKPHEVMELLFDENEIEQNQAIQFMNSKGTQKKTKKRKNPVKIEEQKQKSSRRANIKQAILAKSNLQDIQQQNQRQISLTKLEQKQEETSQNFEMDYSQINQKDE